MSIRLVKIKAGALQYVLIISIVIAILLLTFVLLINLQRQTTNRRNFYKEAIFNVHQGFDLLKIKDLPYNETIDCRFSNSNKEKTSIVKKVWGIYDLAIVKSIINTEFFEKIGLLGYENKEKNALYLEDNNTPLVLVGNSQIVGDAYLPRQGVKTGNIGGTSFYGNKLILGNQYSSTSNLPKLNRNNSIKEFIKGSYRNDSIQELDLTEGSVVEKTFSGKTFIYESNSDIFLRNIKLKGNIIIKSNQKIIIDKTAVLNDVILIAENIEVREKVEGNFQAFAIEAIKVQNNCTLSYPSALVVQKSAKENGELIIGEDCDIRGVLIYENNHKTQSHNFKPQIVIGSNTSIHGEVYCGGKLELLGNINGLVNTKGFIANQFGSIYINHIYNGRIDRRNLPNEYVGLLSSSTKQEVAKWLY